MPPRNPSLVEVAAGRVGILKASKVMAFMIAWFVAADDLGHEPTLQEYADWWNEPRSTAFRHQALFREAFPGEATPSRLMDATAAAWATNRSRRPSPKTLGAAPFPA